jgi:hypothetical protein
MPESKYARLITHNFVPGPSAAASFPPGYFEKYPEDPSEMIQMNWIEGDMIPGSLWFSAVMVLKPTPEGQVCHIAHTHDWDEVMSFYGADPDDPEGLGGEFDFTVGDEKFTFTTAVSIFLPSGTPHGPVIYKKVTRPIFMVGIGNPEKGYTQNFTEDWENW